MKMFAKGIGFGIKAVYCNDKFLVIHSDGSPNHLDSLNLIPRPPGGGTGSYQTSCVTRNRETQFLSFKIPLYPVELPSASLNNNVASFPANSMLPNIPLPISGPVAYAVNGLPLFPPYNNVGQLTWLTCEMDGCNAHVGQGFDYHYHGDPYGANCLYSSSDYSNEHPPVIGLSADGFLIYGRYLNVSSQGYSIDLDICGGHNHDTFGYHYHAQVLTFTAPSSNLGLIAGQTVTGYIGGPYKCK
jgi:hypothetical protein